MPVNDPSLWQLVHYPRHKTAQRLQGGLAAPEREAALFSGVLCQMPIGLEPGETLAGDLGRGYLSPEERAALDEEIAVCEAAIPPPVSLGEPSIAQLMEEWFHCRAGYTTAHTCL